jgi:cation/acetate symporter
MSNALGARGVAPGALLSAIVLVVVPAAARADTTTITDTTRQTLNPLAIAMFLGFVAISLGITWWAARRGTRAAKDFYAAGGGLGGIQNGLAIAGDYTSAATFLGVTALVYTAGYDGMIYAIGFLVGFPMLLLLVAEPLRNLGRYTFADVAAYRLREIPLRTMAGTNTLLIVLFYLIAQMVGAGKLIQLLFGLPYIAAIGIVGALMMLYVTFGGMLATTWVQMIKAVLLLSGSIMMSALILARFRFNPEALFHAAAALHPKGTAIMAPGGLVKDPISAVSLGVALVFGTAGLPHILMRFFTVADVRQARTSVLVATGFISIFYTLLFVLGFGAIALVSGQRWLLGPGTSHLAGGANMVALQLAEVLGGPVLLGFISAVAFATILAVVSGLTIAGATAASHDLYAHVLRRGRAKELNEVRVSKAAAVAISLLAMALGVVFERQNIAFMVGLVFAIAASANFPVLVLSISWSGLTTRGAVAGSLAGLLSAVSLVIFGPGVWTSTLGLGPAPFPYDNPALLSVPLAFAVCWAVSVFDSSAAAMSVRRAFVQQHVRAQTGFAVKPPDVH